MTRAGRPWLAPVLVAGAAALLVGALGATVTELGAWYYSLVQPVWAPPDALFGPAWTLIFATATLAAVAAWTGTRSTRARENLVGLFALNGLLNILWSFLFFRAHRPDWALAEGIALWLSIAALMLVCRRASRIAGLLLVPYLAWVSFALVLNLAIIRLNGSFG